MGTPGTLLVMTSTVRNRPPSTPTWAALGSRRVTNDTASTMPRAGSARWPATNSCRARIRSPGSSIWSGTRKRVGTNWLPPPSPGAAWLASWPACVGAG